MRQKRKRHQHLISLAKIAFSTLLIVWLLQRIGPGNLTEQFARASWPWMLASLTIFILSNILGAWQWHLLLKSKALRPAFSQSLAWYHIGLFFNNFLVGNVGGDAFRIYEVKQFSGQINGAVSTVFFDRFVGFFALSSLALFVSAVWVHNLATTSAIYAILFIFIGWMFGLFFLFSRNFALKFAWIFRLLLPRVVHGKAREIYYAIHAFRHDKRLLLYLFANALVIQSLRILTHYWAARAMGIDAPAIYFFLFIPLVALAASMPISLGGIGVREQSAVALFSQVGIPAAQTVAFELLAYLVGILATVPGGLIFALKGERVQKVADETE